VKNSKSITDTIERLFDSAPYFSIHALREHLTSRGWSYKPDTVKTYLSRQKKEGKIFDAGRGWYSSLPEPYQLDTAPVEKLVGELKGAFPLLDFACWSTAQLNEMLRHQLAKHVQFAYVERDAIESVADWLRDNGYRSWANPSKKERQSFAIEENAVVVLPLTTEAPHQEGFAKIEKILVDVFADCSDFSIINTHEFSEGVALQISKYRVDISVLQRYSIRRKTKVLEVVDHLIN
jgi:hypothetical protein